MDHCPTTHTPLGLTLSSVPFNICSDDSLNVEKACFSNLQDTQGWKGYPDCTTMIHTDCGIGFPLCCCTMATIEKIIHKDFDLWAGAEAFRVSGTYRTE